MTNLFLETLNGAWALLAVEFLIFLAIYHLHPDMTIKYEVPTGPEVARVLATIALAELLTRGNIWAWRLFYGAQPFSGTQLLLLGIAGCIGGWGFLCAIRLYSRPFFGDRPWRVCMVTVLLYSVGNLALRG